MYAWCMSRWARWIDSSQPPLCFYFIFPVSSSSCLRNCLLPFHLPVLHSCPQRAWFTLCCSNRSVWFTVMETSSAKLQPVASRGGKSKWRVVTEMSNSKLKSVLSVVHFLHYCLANIILQAALPVSCLNPYGSSAPWSPIALQIREPFVEQKG